MILNEQIILIMSLLIIIIISILSFYEGVKVGKKEYLKQNKKKQLAGIQRAKEAGVYKGRKPVKLPEGFGDIVNKWVVGEFTAKEAYTKLEISKTTFYRKFGHLKREETK